MRNCVLIGHQSPPRIGEGFSHRRSISRAVTYNKYISSSSNRSMIRFRSSFMLPLLSGVSPSGWAICFSSLRQQYSRQVLRMVSNYVTGRVFSCFLLLVPTPLLWIRYIRITSFQPSSSMTTIQYTASTSLSGASSSRSRM